MTKQLSQLVTTTIVTVISLMLAQAATAMVNWDGSVDPETVGYSYFSSGIAKGDAWTFNSPAGQSTLDNDPGDDRNGDGYSFFKIEPGASELDQSLNWTLRVKAMFIDENPATAGTKVAIRDGSSVLQFVFKNNRIECDTCSGDGSLVTGSATNDILIEHIGGTDTARITVNDIDFGVRDIVPEVDTPNLRFGGLGGAPDLAVAKFDFVYLNRVVIPEPAAVSLLGMGGLALLRRRRDA